MPFTHIKIFSKKHEIKLIMLAIIGVYLINTLYALTITKIAIDHSITDGSLVIAGLLLPTICLSLGLGWLSDVFGRKKILLLAMGLNTVTLLLPTLQLHGAFIYLLIGAICIGLSNNIWTSIGITALLDKLDNHSFLSNNKHIIVLGLGIDLAKLASIGLLALLFMNKFIFILPIIIFAILLGFLGVYFIPNRLSVFDNTFSKNIAPKTIFLITIGFVIAVFVQEFAGNQQSGMIAIGSIISGQTIVLTGFIWILGAILGSLILLINLPLRLRHFVLTVFIYAIGFIFLTRSGPLVLFGIFCNGMANATFWQTLRGFIIAKLPANHRGRFSGSIYTASTISMTISMGLILYFGTKYGYSPVFYVSTLITLFAILPFIVTTKFLNKKIN